MRDRIREGNLRCAIIEEQTRAMERACTNGKTSASNNRACQQSSFKMIARRDLSERHRSVSIQVDHVVAMKSSDKVNDKTVYMSRVLVAESKGNYQRVPEFKRGQPLAKKSENLIEQSI